MPTRTPLQPNANLPTPPQKTLKLRRLLPALMLLLLLWGLLSKGQGWYFGVPLVLLAVWAGYHARLDPGSLQLRYLPSLIGFLLLELGRGGWDVARRAWHPHLPLAPVWVSYDLSSRDPRMQLLLSALVGLLPGSLAYPSGHFGLQVHTLDQQQDWRRTVERLEWHLARLLGDPPR